MKYLLNCSVKLNNQIPTASVSYSSLLEAVIANCTPFSRISVNAGIWKENDVFAVLLFQSSLAQLISGNIQEAWGAINDQGSTKISLPAPIEAMLRNSESFADFLLCTTDLAEYYLILSLATDASSPEQYLDRLQAIANSNLKSFLNMNALDLIYDILNGNVDLINESTITLCTRDNWFMSLVLFNLSKKIIINLSKISKLFIQKSI